MNGFRATWDFKKLYNVGQMRKVTKTKYFEEVNKKSYDNNDKRST